jgi:hypothetical protein
MKHYFFLAISILAGTAVMLGAVAVLLFAALYIEGIQMTVLRVGARIITLLLGMMLMVAATYFSTHLVVRLFRHDAPPPETSN